MSELSPTHDFIMFQTDYESQISEVSNGKQMSELSHINIPSPPPLPDSVSRFFKN